MTQHRNCPECGSDPYKTQDYDKIVREMNSLSSRYKMMSASHGQDRASWEIKALKLEEGMTWLQRKVKKQAQALARLEAKLRRHGEQPYAEDSSFTFKSSDGKITVEER